MGGLIDYFCVQFYINFGENAYENCIENGYPPEKIIMGMESGQFTKDTFQKALQEVHNTLSLYPSMGGVFDWEYLNAPPDDKDPSKWASLMKICSNTI